MLLELRIENFAVIRRLSVRPGPGLNVLTGETGAGKSIIVGALGLLLGERASSEVVRPEADRALVEGVFELRDNAAARALLEEQGIAVEEDLVILRREVAAEGRNRAWVNGSPSTAGVVGRLGRALVDLHGQHEHQNLLRGDEQQAILDAYAGCGDLLAELGAVHGAWRDARAELDGLEAKRREVEQRAGELRFQVREIEAARPESGEIEALEEEANRLEHAEELVRIAGQLHELLYADEASVTARLAAARRQLEQLLRIDSGQAELRELLDTAYYNAEEAGRRLGDYATAAEHDPARLEALHRRQDVLFRLLRKYGPGLEDVMETGRRARQELDLLDSGELARRELEKRVAERRESLETLAGGLSGKRADAARALAAEVQAILPELGLAEGHFEVVLTPLPDIAATGAESVEFRVSLNKGFEPRALARVASGGELSRIMLALKTVLARLDAVPSLVFDEIDAGIGGRTAHQVAEKLKSVAECHQVFAITHLAQIAARADRHFLVEKLERGGTTVTQVSLLEGDARIADLARMLGGDPASAASLRHARELLGAAVVE